jgi:hypothetical protein
VAGNGWEARGSEMLYSMQIVKGRVSEIRRSVRARCCTCDTVEEVIGKQERQGKEVQVEIAAINAGLSGATRTLKLVRNIGRRVLGGGPRGLQEGSVWGPLRGRVRRVGGRCCQRGSFEACSSKARQQLSRYDVVEGPANCHWLPVTTRRRSRTKKTIRKTIAKICLKKRRLPQGILCFVS